MRVSDVDANVLRACGALGGAAIGAALAPLADRLPRRYGIAYVAPAPKRRKRTLSLVVLAAACGVGVAHVIASAMGDRELGAAALLFFVNLALAAAVLTAAAIDLEHMILPNELTLGGALLCLVTSPWRSVGVTGALVGAGVGLVVSYVPFVLYKKLRGQSGMGLGDAKLAIMAGAWQGAEGAIFVLFAGALQSTLAAVLMRALSIEYGIPESVKAEIAELRARAEAGDEEARAELADDPMAGEGKGGVMGMRLPLGPFLALACVELLVARRWIFAHLLGWLAP